MPRLNIGKVQAPTPAPAKAAQKVPPKAPAVKLPPKPFPKGKPRFH
jgi:hypothetical protein